MSKRPNVERMRRVVRKSKAASRCPGHTGSEPLKPPAVIPESGWYEWSNGGLVKVDYPGAATPLVCPACGSWREVYAIQAGTTITQRVAR
jgi:hypothetical protein